MPDRFVDQKDFVKESSEFVVREHGYPNYIIWSVFAAVIIIGLLTANYITNKLTLSAIFSVLVAALFYVSTMYMNKYRAVIQTIELQNALFSGAARMVADFCMIVRHDGKVVYVDHEYKSKIPGLRDNGLDAISDKGFIDKKSLEKLYSALNSGRSEKVDFKMVGKSSSEQKLTLSLEPIGITPHGKGRLSLAVNPITRPSGYFFLKVQEDTASGAITTQAMDNFAVGYYEVDRSGKFVSTNNQFWKNLGYSSAQTGLTSFDDIAFSASSVSDLKENQNEWLGFVYLKDAKDLPVKMLVNQVSIQNRKNKESGYQGVCLPCPRENMNENDSESVFIDNMPIPTVTMDFDGTITKCNKAFFDFFDGVLSKAEGQKIYNMVDATCISDLNNYINDVIKNNIDNGESIEIKIVGEEDLTVTLYLKAYNDSSNNPSGLVGHLLDTTEHKNLEMRFVHSQKMQAVGQLAGGIAHDFNNLLTAMMGFCDLLLIKHPAGDQSFAEIMQIKQNANRAANLVRQLLAFSRKQTLQPDIHNITDILADLSNLIGRLIGENITLDMVHGRDLYKIKVDQGQLEQVIINLAVNARDAMPEGGTLSIRTSNIKIDSKNNIAKNMIAPAEDEVIEKGDYVLIEIEDTGCGIDKKHIGKIFEPFYSTKEIGAGTGLGLSTVYGIIKQTDGYVYVSSKVGKGTKFSIFLRGYENIQKPEVQKETEKSSKLMASDLTGTGTVLLVEDETPVRIFSHSALKNKGYNVLEADCAARALEIFREQGEDIDIIITDVVMPGMSGPDMVKEIYKKRPDIKVIFMSGYGEDAFIESFGKERKFNFLSKPYTLKQLATKVKDVLEEKVKVS